MSDVGSAEKYGESRLNNTYFRLYSLRLFPQCFRNNYKRLVNWQNGTKWVKMWCWCFLWKPVKIGKSMRVEQGHSAVDEWVEKHKCGWNSVADSHLLYHVFTLRSKSTHVIGQKKYQIWGNSLSDKMPKYFMTQQEKISYYPDKVTNLTDYFVINVNNVHSFVQSILTLY